MTADGHYTYTYDPENRLTQVQKPNPPAQQLNSFAAYTKGGDAVWVADGSGFAKSGTIDDEQESCSCLRRNDKVQTTVEGAGTVTFWWKVSSESGCDFLQLWVDGVLRDSRNGEEEWAQKTYTITTAGTHTIQWRYQKDGSSSEGDDCGWVDWVQWSGPLPEPAADAWATLNYLYDAGGRRIEKRCDGRTITKYVYDGDHCLAEYDGSGNLRRKYIYGPCTDEPVCMIESTQSYAGTYYYHFDALGSVVALTNSSGNTVEVYEYDVYGRVGASDPNHPNRFLFTGREYDKETGLYYYRARYYNPQIGRFLQTDPVGYGAGMNLYAYCGNGPTGRVDPSGCTDHDDFYWIFSFTFPAWCAGDPGILNKTTVGELANRYFTNTGFFGMYPAWFINETTLSPDGDQITVTFRSAWYWWQQGAPTEPKMGVVTADVRQDASDPDSGVVDHVPLVSVDGKLLLTIRAFNRIMKPTFDEIDALPKSLNPGVALLDLLTSWDSWFWSVGNDWTFIWEGDLKAYKGNTINFAAGGYAFRHYGIPSDLAAGAVYDYELVQGLLRPFWMRWPQIRMPWNPVVQSEISWCLLGYFMTLSYSPR